MTRSLAIGFALGLALAGTAAGQAGVEAGLGAARAVTTTAPVKGIGKALSGLSGTLDKAIKPGQQDSNEQAAPAATPKTVARTAASIPAAPVPTWEDPAGVETGLAYDELVRRFGPPIMSVSNTASRSLTYRGKDGYYQIETREGVVAAIVRPEL